jgi:hypothetical protein
MKEYEMELRIVAKIEAHDIAAAQKKAAAMRTEMCEAFPAIEVMEFATNFSLRPCHDRPHQGRHVPGYPDPHNARKVFDRCSAQP